MKKISLFLVIVLTILCFGGTVAFAQNDPVFLTIPENDNYVTAAELEADRAEFEALLAQGAAIQPGRQRAAVAISVTPISQTNSKWSTTLMPCGHATHTYGNVGCAMTSYAMALNSTAYSGLTPVTVATTYGTGACSFSSETLLSKYSKVTGTKGTVSNFTELTNFVKASIGQWAPVVVRLTKGSNMHFVVADGYYSDPPTSTTNYVLTVVDPDPRLGFTSLNAAYNAGWTADIVVKVK